MKVSITLALNLDIRLPFALSLTGYIGLETVPMNR